MGDEEDEQSLKPRKMDIDDEFMQHPDSGAFIRNPLKTRMKSMPILLSASEFNHNMLDDTLGEWHCISVGEKSFKDLMAHYADTHGSSMSSWSRTASFQKRCSVGRVHSLNTGFDFVVQVRKSTYVAPRKKAPRAGDRKDAPGHFIEKLNMDVTVIDGRSLRVDSVTEGIIAVWNRTHQNFPVKVGDVITRVNDKKNNAGLMLEELKECSDLVRMICHRTSVQRSMSRDQTTRSSPLLTLAGEGTMLPPSQADFSASSLVKPEGSGRRPSLTKT